MPRLALSGLHYLNVAIVDVEQRNGRTNYHYLHLACGHVIDVGPYDPAEQPERLRVDRARIKKSAHCFSHVPRSFDGMPQLRGNPTPDDDGPHLYVDMWASAFDAVSESGEDANNLRANVIQHFIDDIGVELFATLAARHVAIWGSLDSLFSQVDELGADVLSEMYGITERADDTTLSLADALRESYGIPERADAS